MSILWVQKYYDNSRNIQGHCQVLYVILIDGFFQNLKLAALIINCLIFIYLIRLIFAKVKHAKNKNAQ